MAMDRSKTAPARGAKPLWLALPGAALAAVAVALGFGLSSANVGPKAPPLADLEAALAGPDPLQVTAPADPDLETQTAALTPTAPLPPPLDPAAQAAVAAEAAAPVLNRQLEIKRGDTLMRLLTDAGIARPQAHSAITALAEVYNPHKLKPGQRLRLALATDPASAGEDGEAPLSLLSLSLSASAEEDVHVARQPEGAGFLARAEARPLERRVSAHGGTIELSLYEAARAAGMPNEVMIELIRLFSFDVDFQREVQPGDSFQVLYDSYFDRGGALAKTGTPRYASMVLSGKRIEFYHFVTEGGLDDHFDAKGQSVRRALLKTPVDGARISSGYGMRKHPIQGYTRMHKGVDFAAPRGTPIYAAGRGVIESIGRNGGYGKYIRIRHNGTYKTAYAHMKGYAGGLKRGARVKQGQVIGYVGSTGNSTGPHLHYEIFVNGKRVNPRKIKLPSGKKLAGADLEAFQKARAEIDRLRAEAFDTTMMAESGCGGELAVALAAEATAESEPTGESPKTC
jgi:murein DD-endopeptidase MepM/ murein hydrolase activator NlpD